MEYWVQRILKIHLSTLALCLGALLLGACGPESDVVSGEARAPSTDPRPLSARQVQLINVWLNEHRSGWSRLVVATPPPTSSLSVTVRRANGESGTIDFYAQEGWKGGLMYRSTEPGDNRQGTFAPEQVSALRRELERSQ
jgi:hypothetical protein